MTSQFTRRRVLRGAGTALLGSALSGRAAARAVDDEREVLHEFGYGDVRLTGGPLGSHYQAIHAHYLSLDNDRLLKIYRQHAGMDAPGKEMGGWYGTNGFIPGHSFGQYVSGLARFGSGTGDAACHAKVRQMVEEFGRTLQRNPDPYAGEGAEKLWPAYVLDKHEIGLIDAYRLSGVAAAAELLPRVISGALPFISPDSRDRIGKKDPPYDETYVLPENLFAVAEITKNQRYHALATHYLLDQEFFDPLARGEDVLPGKHAYSHAISLSSAAKAYLVLGETKYKKALVNAWEFLERQRYASGGWGPEELFITPHRGALYDSLSNTKAHFETPCGSYANLKLARYLLRFTGEARYGDGLERDIFNTILATRKPDSDGDYPYYSTYGPGASKQYYDSKWPCCSGTLAQAVADYPLNIYFHSANALFVNLYAPSQLVWRRSGEQVLVRQETDFPAGDKITIRLSLNRPRRFEMRLRIPGWVAAAPRLTVNRRPFKTAVMPASFATIDRTWSNGDTIELVLPQSFRTLAIDELHPETVALMKGPLMYVGIDTTGEAQWRSIAPSLGLKPLPLSRQRYLRQERDTEQVFVPYYLVGEETYETYFRSA
jgi:hypothetical protein